ncbi:MAG: glycosyltransferase family 87 protein [Bacillota bacterium]
MFIVVMIAIIGYVFFMPSEQEDFSAYYYAAKVILDPQAPSNAVYDLDFARKNYCNYNIDAPLRPYIYSVAAAYIFAPIALLPFQAAKLIFNYICLALYIMAIAVTAIYANGPHKKQLLLLLTIALMWLPFLNGLTLYQINPLLLFILSVAVLAATRNHPVLSGVLLGFASLFKLFPLLIAMALGVKNWRIFTGCIVVFMTSFFIPGSFDWFPAISHITRNYTVFYRLGYLWYGIYLGCVVAVMGVTFFRTRSENYGLISALSVPAVLLIMPIVEYNHLTLLIFSYIYIWINLTNWPGWFWAAATVSFLIIQVYKLCPYISYIVGLLILWFSFVLVSNRKYPLPEIEQPLKPCGGQS